MSLPKALPQSVFKASNPDQFESWSKGIEPDVEDLGQGLWSIPVPIPHNKLLGYTLVYALELESGVAVIDVGWDADESWGALLNGLARFGASAKDVRHIIGTHYHRDHFGLAGRLQAASDASVALHEKDVAMLQPSFCDPEGRVRRGEQLLMRMGGNDDDLEAAREALRFRGKHCDLATPDVIFKHADVVRLGKVELEVIHTPGHTPGHVCLYDAKRRVVFAGDHVIPHISRNVLTISDQYLDGLADFMASLDTVDALRAEEVMPAHEYRFVGLHDRIEQLRAQHERRFSEITAVLEAHESMTCFELAAQLKWSRAWESTPGWTRFKAGGETIAHLVVLERRGVIEKSGQYPEYYRLTCGDLDN